MSPGRKRVNLALQGGGAHGAFTWGVLDRLLEEERLEIEGVSATGSGAFAAAALAHGLAEGGPETARATLDRFWDRYAAMAPWNPLQPNWLDRFAGNWNVDASAATLWLGFATQLLAPAQFNPLSLSPLRIALAGTIDIERVRAAPVKLFITATNVRTGKIRVFESAELTLDMLLAAACLPQLSAAVVIDGEPYWDGGLMGNPAIFPLIYGSAASDVVIVQLDPITHEGVPTTAADILDRLNEITFNANLMREMRAIAFVQKLIATQTGRSPAVGRLKRMYIHMIGDEAAMRGLGLSSKFSTDRDFLRHLKTLGRRRAETWLGESFAALGERSTVDLEAMFL